VGVLGIDFSNSSLRFADDKSALASELVNIHCDELPFVVKPPNHGDPTWKIDSIKRQLDFDSLVSVGELSQRLQDIWRQLMGRFVGESLRCVAAVPPCFSQRQRKALISAFASAGFPGLSLVDDTFAVLIRFLDFVKSHQKVMVISWGADSCSVYLYRLAGKGIQNLSTEGNRELGGDDLDGSVATLLWQQLSGSISHNVLQSSEFVSQFICLSRNVKLQLLTGGATRVPVGEILRNPHFGIPNDLIISIPPDSFVSFVDRMVRECLQHMNAVLRFADINSPDAILLAGGMTRLDAFRELLKLNFPVPIYEASENDIALGCVAYGQRLAIPEQSKIESLAPKGPRGTLNEPSANNTGTRCWADNFTEIFGRAQQFEREKRFEECVATLDELFRELTLFCLQPFRHLASIYEKQGQFDKAFEIFRRLHERNPDDQRISTYLIEFSAKHFDQLYKAGKPSLALERAELAVSLLGMTDKRDPQYSKALAALMHREALALCSLSRFAEAKTTVEKCIKLDPDKQRYHEVLEKIRSEILNSGKRAKRKRKAKRDRRHNPGA
jgi:hypothetical protein